MADINHNYHLLLGEGKPVQICPLFTYDVGFALAPFLGDWSGMNLRYGTRENIELLGSKQQTPFILENYLEEVLRHFESPEITWTGGRKKEGVYSHFKYNNIPLEIEKNGVTKIIIRSEKSDLVAIIEGRKAVIEKSPFEDEIISQQVLETYKPFLLSGELKK